MINTSATCILAGAETWSREWVRYEIGFSIWRGNGLFSVFIDRVPCMNAGLSERGPDPLEFMAVGYEANGKPYLWERTLSGWVRYDKIKHPVPWPKWLPKAQRGWVQPLSVGSSTYDYAGQDGFSNLAAWAQKAARAAGK